MTFGRKKPKRDDPLAAMRKVRPVDETEVTPETVRAHEDGAAELFGGERHRGSGASPFLKSDASSERYQIECKQTEGASIALRVEWLKKINFEAIGRGRVPAMHLRFLRNLPANCERDWVMLPASEVRRLLEAAR